MKFLLALVCCFVYQPFTSADTSKLGGYQHESIFSLGVKGPVKFGGISDEDDVSIAGSVSTGDTFGGAKEVAGPVLYGGNNLQQEVVFEKSGNDFSEEVVFAGPFKQINQVLGLGKVDKDSIEVIAIHGTEAHSDDASDELQAFGKTAPVVEFQASKVPEGYNGGGPTLGLPGGAAVIDIEVISPSKSQTPVQNYANSFTNFKAGGIIDTKNDNPGIGLYNINGHASNIGQNGVQGFVAAKPEIKLVQHNFIGEQTHKQYDGFRNGFHGNGVETKINEPQRNVEGYLPKFKQQHQDFNRASVPTPKTGFVEPFQPQSRSFHRGAPTYQSSFHAYPSGGRRFIVPGGKTIAPEGGQITPGKLVGKYYARRAFDQGHLGSANFRAGQFGSRVGFSRLAGPNGRVREFNYN